MAYTSRFVDEAALHASVPGCPLATTPPRDDESACAGCRYNVAFPKTPQIGCHVRTPPAVMDGARAQLQARDPSLATTLHDLRAGAGAIAVDVERAAAFIALAERWLQIAVSDEEREVASVILRFARAAALRPVEIVR